MNMGHPLLFLIAIAILLGMSVLIVFGDKGLADLNQLETSHHSLEQRNQRILRQNIDLYRKIRRLRSDYRFLETVARRELGVVGKDEIIFKLQTPSAKKGSRP